MSTVYLRSSDIKLVHFEITSRCNLLCPQCARVHDGALNAQLPLQDLPWLPNIDKLFSESFCRQLDAVYFCGNYGDPAASPNLEFFVDQLLLRQVSRIGIYSNGSLRSPDWWFSLGRKLWNRGWIALAIDGLEDTNKIYRVQSSWKRLVENLKALIATKVHVRWEFLVFKHNEHQIKQAIDFAKSIGVKDFNLKFTSRFDGQKNTFSGKKLSLPRDPNLQPPTSKNLSILLEKYGSFDRYVRATPIRCKTQNDARSIYIDFNGSVWPCCWVGAPKYFGPSNQQAQSLNHMLKKYEQNFNSLKHHTFDQILSHSFFERDLVQSWSSSERLYTCGRTCGKEYEFTSYAGYGNNRLIPLEMPGP